MLVMEDLYKCARGKFRSCFGSNFKKFFESLGSLGAKMHGIGVSGHGGVKMAATARFEIA